jgi:hypothetical protein
MSRIEDRKDDTLLYDLGGSEHPTILFLDAQGAVLARHDTGDCSVAALEATGAKVLRSLDLARKAEGDAGARADLAIVRCDLGVIEFSDLESEIEGLPLTAEQQKSVGVLRADATVADMMQVLRRNRDDAAKRLVAEEFVALYRAGTHPGRTGHRLPYWTVLAGQAVAAKDAAMLRDAIAGLRAIHGPEPSPRAAAQLAEMEKRLQEIEAAK